jgi:hypothetical protein
MWAKSRNWPSVSIAYATLPYKQYLWLKRYNIAKLGTHKDRYEVRRYRNRRSRF